ncbi:hypothetical protein ACC697_04060 [Rhizobium ruizarguesonis]
MSFDYSKAFDEVRDKRFPKIVVSEAAYPKSADVTPPARIDFAEIFAGVNIRDQKAARDVMVVGVN